MISYAVSILSASSRPDSSIFLASASSRAQSTVPSIPRVRASFPDIEQLWKCAKVLHTDPNDLLGWYEEHPEDKPTAPTGAEGELITCYRQSTEKRRSKILETARDQAELSQNQPAAPEIEGLEADQVRSA